MVVKLKEVVPFGRSLDEYVKMFNLSPNDLKRRIVGAADGPASFNAEATEQGYSVTSVDPLYQFTTAEIQNRFDAVVDDIIEQVRKTADDYVWTYHTSPDALKASRCQSIQRFLADYPQGKHVSRYVVGELPHLPFPDQNFGLALCSHFLFLYSEQCNYDFHRDAVLELLRVSTEVRIFPLMTLMLEQSPHLLPLIHDLENQGYTATIQTSQYEFQKGGNEVLILHS